jgi:deoxyribodipyrimidine photo-lyase
MGIQVVWFKRDLRVEDHEPLVRAAGAGPVVGLYILEPELLALPETDPRHLGFILESLAELRRALRARGSRLWIRRGEAVEVLDELADTLPVAALWSHEETGLRATWDRDRRVEAWRRRRGIPWTELPQSGVVRGLRNRDRWARHWEERMDRPPRPAPERFAALPPEVAAQDPGALPRLRELGMQAPDHPQQPGGATEGRRTLETFLDVRGVDYRSAMASPLAGWDSCSRLSPHLAWGTVSLRTVHHRAAAALLEARVRARDGDPELDRRWIPSLRSFQSRLRWHCHFIQKLESEPELEEACMNRAYEGLRTADPAAWSTEEEARFRAWRDGRTGHPMVDACVRSLDATGWLNFRMRAMLVSFAAYHLWLDWRPVARVLARRFLDFEPGIHLAQCQMQSGVTGINALRIYDPAKQLRDHDPEGRFVRRWVPELREVPDSWLSRPELMPRPLQERVGCVIGRDYPWPVVQQAPAVREARARIGAVRTSARARHLAREVYRRHGSRKQPPGSRARGGAMRRRRSGRASQLDLGI